MIPGRELPCLKALTLIRPWSDAIVCGPKRIENRGWLPPLNLIGTHIALHAGAKYDDHVSWPQGWYPPGPSPLGIVGVARLAAVRDARRGIIHVPSVGPALTNAEIERFNDMESDPWWVGPVGFFLTEVIALPDAVECKGALGLWRVPC
jgi:hypothetical protein